MASVTIDTKKEIIQAFVDGIAIPDIAAEFDLPSSIIKEILVENGVYKSNDNEIIEKYKGGVPIKDILNEFGISISKLYLLLAEHNVPTRNIEHTDGHKAQLDAAIALYEKGVPIWQITQETGIHQPTLHAELHARGIPLRRYVGKKGQNEHKRTRTH